MGHQKRRHPAPASAVPAAPDKHAPNNMNGSVAVVKSSAPSANVGAQAPYQLYNLRAARDIDPRRLVESFKNSLPVTHKVPNRIPVVLDMSAFHPDGSPHYIPPANGTLASFANAIRSTDNLSIVGVTNLPPPEVKGGFSSMVGEAQSLNLAILQSSVLELNPSMNTAPQLSARKKRGGVAPLLRPRRPVALNKTEPESIHDSKDDVNNAKQFANVTAAEAESSSAKVHKGSIRSGQLVTSDFPNQSLVIIGSINPGGEVWSEGDVFVFGKLRGRVLAGLRNVGGNTDQIGDRPLTTTSKEESKRSQSNTLEDHSKKRQSSKIFATFFDPELICIGDTFTTIDDVSKLGLDGVGPAFVTLDSETGELSFERFDMLT
jgi:septum formation inhibitor MinC